MVAVTFPPTIKSATCDNITAVYKSAFKITLSVKTLDAN